MGKLIKVVVMLAIVVGGIALVVHYSSGSDDKDKPVVQQDTQKKESQGVQPQEKYGFAPMDE